MNQDLPRFTPGVQIECPKCQKTAAPNDKWLPRGQRVRRGSGVNLIIFRGECIVRRCKSCGYVWAEQTADAPMSPELREVSEYASGTEDAGVT